MNETIDALMLARFMFERNAFTYTDDYVEIQRVWVHDTEVKKFWVDEAENVLSFLGFTAAGEKVEVDD